MSIKQDCDRLSQDKMLTKLRRTMSMADMLTVYLEHGDDAYWYGMYCALIPSKQLDRVLGTPHWDLMHGDGLPSSVTYREDGDEKVDYLRYGNTKGIEPLVIDREFHNIRKGYLEINEEFRLFHRLYHDQEKNQYIKIDEDEEEQIVAVVKPDCVNIRLKEIRQFLAIKEMYLSIQFDCKEHSNYTLEELGLVEGGKDQRNKLCHWNLHYAEQQSPRYQHAFSRLIGKRLIEPLPKSKSGYWGFDQGKKKYVDFIIDEDDQGEVVEYTCDPDNLNTPSGARPYAPYYETSISFHKKVLDKYYQQPDKYEIENIGDFDRIYYGSLWSIEVYKSQNDKVFVNLGDIGRKLSYEDQLHWRAHNISPVDGLKGQWIDPKRPEQVFLKSYRELAQVCQERLGCSLLSDLNPDDRHHLRKICVPAKNEQQDFDERILGLTKILIDSINENELKSLIPRDQYESTARNIRKLEILLDARGVVDASEHIAFLRKLQNLRSAGSAHRKGKNYRRIFNDLSEGSHNLGNVFIRNLKRANALLEYLIELVRSNRISQGSTKAETDRST